MLTSWDDVYEAAGEPGPLGSSKAANVRAYIEGAQRDIERYSRFLGQAEADLATERRRRLR